MKSRAEMNERLLDLCRKQKFEEIRRLLFSGEADINCRTEPSNFTPLHYCVQSSNTEIPEFLIMCGADVDVRDIGDRTPLLQHIPDPSVELLIRQRADINAQNSYGWTGLHYAAFDSRREAAEMLLKHKADCTLKEHFGQTPADFATENQGLKDLLNEAIKQKNLSTAKPK